MLLALGAGCKRESPVLVQEVIIPVGFHGWLQIVQDDPNCPKAELRHRRIVPGSDHSGVICIAEELPALEWFRREYRFDDGSVVPPSDVQQEGATARRCAALQRRGCRGRCAAATTERHVAATATRRRSRGAGRRPGARPPP